MAAVWEDVAEIPTGAPNLAADAQMTVNWTLYRSLPTFDMKNGMVEDVSSILVRETIALSWHWVPVVGMPPDMAMQHLEAYIRSHHYHLATNAPNNYSPALIRKIAIILGTMRAAATTYYRITPADVIIGEVTQPYLRAAKTAGGEFVYSAINDSTAEDPHRNLLIGALSFTTAEQNAIVQLVKCGMGMVPMQGYSLVMTGHHYLSSVESQSRKVFLVPEKAYWVGNDVKEWFSSDMASIQDAAWHKAGHPISMDLKIDRAMDIKVKDMLIAAGAGACASRLPAVETELRTASSYESLMKTVSPMFEMCGGSVDVTILSRMIELVKSFPTSGNPAEAPQGIPDVWRNTVTTRKEAIKKLGQLISGNQDNVAWCYGFYCAQSENMGMTSAAAGSDTLKTSFSLSKLRGQSHSAYTNGYMAYGDYQAARNRAGMEGGPKFVFK